MKPEIEMQYLDSNEWVETATLIAIKLHLEGGIIRIKFDGEYIAVSVDSNLIIRPVASNAILLRSGEHESRNRG